MKTLILKDISRKYEIGKGKYFTALSTTNLSFDSAGLCAIVGKSGSGKSTLINLISQIDEATTGEIILNGQRFNRRSKKDLYNFYNKEIGIVFQSYNLLEDISALDNVILPLLISGVSKRKAKVKALDTLSRVGINKEIALIKVSKLSGGEKQRVGIARAIVNNPKILLCDEPTGALDSLNSTQVMEILKKISKKSLVIMVSHNLQLVKKYADRIIELHDGRIIRDELINKVDNEGSNQKKTRRISSSWVNRLSLNNFKKRIQRNLFASLSLTISLSMLFLVFGFINNKDKSTYDACYRQLDYGSGTISKEIKIGTSPTLSLTKSSRPTLSELVNNTTISENFEICSNFDAILPSNIELRYDGEVLDGLLFTPIYDFDDKHLDTGLLSNKESLSSITQKQLVINNDARKKIESIIHKDPINEIIHIHHEQTINYTDDNLETISDTFYLDEDFKIVSTVDELSYLSSPKVYYSYCYFESLLQDKILTNLSTYLDKEISWYDRVAEADNNSYISSYSYRLFLKDYRYREQLELNPNFGNSLSFSSSSLLVTSSLFSFLEVAEYGVILFLIIALVGSILIISILSFTNFSEDRNKCAILSSIGASNSSIQDLYLNESIIVGVISFISSVLLSLPLSRIVNHIIYRYVELQDLIKIPFAQFLGVKYLFPVIVFFGILFVLCAATLLPMAFIKRHSIKGELQSL